MDEVRKFKLMIHPFDKNRHKEWPTHIPYDFVKQYEKQIMHNHSQTIERLNQRGGLAPSEIYAAVNGMSLVAYLHDPISEEEAMEFLLQELELYYREGGYPIEKFG